MNESYPLRRGSTTENSLPQLATGINDAHRQCEAAVGTALDHALKAGNLLLKAKAKVEHGQWIGWVDQNCACTLRSAQRYMRLATHAERLAEANATCDTYLTIGEAVALLAEAEAAKHSGLLSEPARHPSNLRETEKSKKSAAQSDIAKSTEKPKGNASGVKLSQAEIPLPDGDNAIVATVGRDELHIYPCTDARYFFCGAIFATDDGGAHVQGNKRAFCAEAIRLFISEVIHFPTSKAEWTRRPFTPADFNMFLYDSQEEASAAIVRAA